MNETTKRLWIEALRSCNCSASQLRTEGRHFCYLGVLYGLYPQPTPFRVVNAGFCLLRSKFRGKRLIIVRRPLSPTRPDES